MDPSEGWKAPPGLLIERATAANLASPELRDLHTYWLAKRGSRFAPARAAIEPKDLRAHLPNLFMVDVVDGGRAFQVTLLGTRMVAAIGEDQTGRIVAADAGDEMGKRAFALARATVDHKCAIRGATAKSTMPRLAFLAAESLYLPLSDDGVSVNKILSCAVFSDPVRLA